VGEVLRDAVTGDRRQCNLDWTGASVTRHRPTADVDAILDIPPEWRQALMASDRGDPTALIKMLTSLVPAGVTRHLEDLLEYHLREPRKRGRRTPTYVLSLTDATYGLAVIAIRYLIHGLRKPKTKIQAIKLVAAVHNLPHKRSAEYYTKIQYRNKQLNGPRIPDFLHEWFLSFTEVDPRVNPTARIRCDPTALIKKLTPLVPARVAPHLANHLENHLRRPLKRGPKILSYNPPAMTVEYKSAYLEVRRLMKEPENPMKKDAAIHKVATSKKVKATAFANWCYDKRYRKKRGVH
jgi:hypothetical protein